MTSDSLPSVLSCDKHFNRYPIWSSGLLYIMPTVSACDKNNYQLKSNILAGVAPEVNLRKVNICLVRILLPGLEWEPKKQYKFNFKPGVSMTP